MIIASVWVIAEGTRKVSEGPKNMRPLNSQAVFPGKYHMPIRAQKLKLGGVLPSPKVSEYRVYARKD